ncbi:response regulator [candidate division KSB1 bacterium]|nr:response regulator [candidate division KSB1 bacterium]
MSNRILIVEDEKNLRQLYQKELEAEGYEVATALNAHEALERLRSAHADLVVLDLILSDGSGLDYLSQFLEVDRHLKVVINSAYSTYRADFHSWAADAYLVKSSDLTELKSTIDHFLHVPQHELQKS